MTSEEILGKAKRLAERLESLQSSLHLPEKQAELGKLKTQMHASDFWDDQSSAQKISRKLSQLEKYVTSWQKISAEISDFPELIELAEVADLPILATDIEDLEKRFDQSETELLLAGDYDDHGAILTINTGTGGQDAEDFSQMLLRMYVRFVDQQGWKATILEESPSDVGLKSAMIEVRGNFAYGLLKAEHGVHRLIRLSPFNAKNLRQTSFSRVEVIPAIEQDTDIDINESDLRIDVFRASGNGGQSVNTTDSAVRITYLPLGISVSCQNEKSQLQNKQSAMKVLKSRLVQLKLEQNAEKLEELRGDRMENSFGSQIRSYTLQPYKLVKDHRTDTEHSNPEKVFDGDLNPFIQAFLRK